MLPFWLSIALLSLVQGGVVAIPGSATAPKLARLRGRRWALIPPVSVLAFVVITSAAEHASAQGLTYLALVAVPLLAAVFLGWPARDSGPGGPRAGGGGPRVARALLVVPLFLLAWVDRGGLAGQAAALVLTALSCVTLGLLLAAVTPPRWLAAGIVAMAIADAALVVSDLLQRPNNALNAAHPAAGLPRLQSAALGSAVMGYGDLFIAAALGGLLAFSAGRSLQWRAARLTMLLALCFDLLFFFVDELPATVPVALTLTLLIAARRRRPAGARPAPAPAAHGPRLAHLLPAVPQPQAPASAPPGARLDPPRAAP
jgi:hypothetical protein